MPTKPESGVSIPEVCGPVWWHILHSVAEGIREKGCKSCGQEAVDFVAFWHDVVNQKLGKPLHDASNFRRTLRHLAHLDHQLEVGARSKNGGTGVRDPASGQALVRGIPFSPSQESVWLVVNPKGPGTPAVHQVATGGSSGAPVPLGKVISLAQREGAREIALVHNHPSGAAWPSADDRAVTQELKRRAKGAGLRLQDHLIVAGHRVVSMMHGGHAARAGKRVAQSITPEEQHKRVLIGRRLQIPMALDTPKESRRTQPLIPLGTIVPSPPGQKAPGGQTEAPQPEWITVSLFPFQREGVAWLRDKAAALLADDMGLGKTLQSIAWASAPGKDRLPALVVCPAFLKLNWEREIHRARPNDLVQVLNAGDAWPGRLADWTILNYDLLVRYNKELTASPFHTAILDEVHYIKNLRAQRTRQALGSLLHIPNRLAVTGTPILNGPAELFPVMAFLGFMRLQEHSLFLERYTDEPEARGRPKGGRNLQELHQKLLPVMLRRRKEDVLKQLPPKLQAELLVPISNAAEYDRAQRDFLSWLAAQKGIEAMDRAARAEALVRMNHLRQLAALGKVEVADDFSRDCSPPDHKYVIFSSFKEPLEKLHALKGGNSVLYTGELSTTQRQALVDRFQNEPIPCYFLGTIGSAGLGITLTKADRVIFLDLPWTPGGKVQAEDRTHRIGQDNKVNVINLLARNTIDERMAEILAEKDVLIQQVIEGTSKEEAAMQGTASKLLSAFARVAQSGRALPSPVQYVPETLEELQGVRDPGHAQPGYVGGVAAAKAQLHVLHEVMDKHEESLHKKAKALISPGRVAEIHKEIIFLQHYLRHQADSPPFTYGSLLGRRRRPGPHVSQGRGDCVELRLPLESVQVRPEKYQYRKGGGDQVGLDQRHVQDLFEAFDPNRLDPIVVRRDEGGAYELLSGHHRLAAFKLAQQRGGFPTAPGYDASSIPALVRAVDEATARQLARLSNASIKEYKPSELAGVFTVESEAGLTPDQIGKMYGARGAGEVQKYLDVARLPHALQEVLDQPALRRAFTLDHAAVLGRAMREHGLSPATVQQIFDRVLKEQDYTANQLERLMGTFGPQLREVQPELFPTAGLKGGLTGILGLIREAMDAIKALVRKRRLLHCVARIVTEKTEAGEPVSRELSHAAGQSQAEITGLEAKIEGIRESLGQAIRKQKAPAPPPEPEGAPMPFVVPKEQAAFAVGQSPPLGVYTRVAAAVIKRAGLIFRGEPTGPPRLAKGRLLVVSETKP